MWDTGYPSQVGSRLPHRPADDLEALRVGAEGRQGIPLSYLLLSVLGYPFKWAKTRGGYRVLMAGYGDGVLLLQTRDVKEQSFVAIHWLNDKVSAGARLARSLTLPTATVLAVSGDGGG